MSNLESKLTNPEIRRLKARAQLLEASFKVGKAGLSEEFIQAVEEALQHRDLIKVKFVEFKEEKRELAEKLAAASSARVIMRVGNVAALYRPRPAPAGDGASA